LFVLFRPSGGVRGDVRIVMRRSEVWWRGWPMGLGLGLGMWVWP
jgi:hypothetical protein